MLLGDTAKAKMAYQDFLTLWKDADPDIPILKQAKAEYAKLQSTFDCQPLRFIDLLPDTVLTCVGNGWFSRNDWPDHHVCAARACVVDDA